MSHKLLDFNVDDATLMIRSMLQYDCGHTYSTYHTRLDTAVTAHGEVPQYDWDDRSSK